MATDKTRLGTAIVTALQAAGLFASDAKAGDIAKAKTQWQAIGGAILDELTGHMEIDLSGGDIKVDPGSFSTSAGPVSGVGIIESASLMGKLK